MKCCDNTNALTHNKMTSKLVMGLNTVKDTDIITVMISLCSLQKYPLLVSKFWKTLIFLNITMNIINKSLQNDYPINSIIDDITIIVIIIINISILLFGGNLYDCNY